LALIWEKVTLEPHGLGAHFSGLSLKKCAPRPCGSVEVFPCKEERFAENRFTHFRQPNHFSLTVVLGQTCSERCSFAAVSGV
jgi:hypothetical protein